MASSTILSLLLLLGAFAGDYSCRASKTDGTYVPRAEFCRESEQSRDEDFDSKIEEIVSRIQSWCDEHDNTSPERPFVTLTFAQSIDGKIALKSNLIEASRSSNLALSGQESRRMTHALRSLHDAILVGGRTLSVDNPRLTNRLWEKSGSIHQPLAVVLDADLKHLQKLGSSRRAARIVVCCKQQVAYTTESVSAVEFLPCRCNDNGMLDLNDVLEKLYKVYGIQSVMVEGGAAVLTNFLRHGLLDCLCITIAPVILGNGLGLAAFSDTESFREPSFKPHLQLQNDNKFYSRFIPIGRDCVYLCRWHDTGMNTFGLRNP